jgi:hypothetical protein
LSNSLDCLSVQACITKNSSMLFFLQRQGRRRCERAAFDRADASWRLGGISKSTKLGFENFVFTAHLLSLRRWKGFQTNTLSSTIKLRSRKVDNERICVRQRYSRDKKKSLCHPSVINLACTIFNFSDPANTNLTPQKAMSFSGPSNPLC